MEKITFSLFFRRGEGLGSLCQRSESFSDTSSGVSDDIRKTHSRRSRRCGLCPPEHFTQRWIPSTAPSAGLQPQPAEKRCDLLV